MIVKIRTPALCLFLPVPLSFVGFVIRLLPDRVFAEMCSDVPAPYNVLLSKESIRLLLTECLSFFKENKGLEVVHVEAQDDTFISIRL